MADLKDVVNSLKDVEETIKNPPKSAADVERANEATRESAANRSIQMDILATLQKGVGGATEANKKSGGLIAGLLGGIGTGIGAIGKSVSKIGPAFIIGMGSLGLGIVAFMVGLGGGAAIAQYAGLNGEALKELVGNTFGAFSGTSLVVLGAVVAAAMLMDTKGMSKKGVALGMGAIGAGIAAFSIGILAADGFAKFGAAAFGLDGTNLSKLLNNAFKAFDGFGIVVFGGILAAAATIGKTGVAGGKAAVIGMTAIGAGIAAFSIGLIAGDAFATIASMLGLNGSKLKILMTNVGEGIGGFIGGIGKGMFKQLEELDSDKLIDLGLGIAGIGAGITLFAAGTAIGTVAGVMSAVTSFLGIDSPIEQIIKISADKRINVKRLKELGEGIGPLGQGIGAFSGLNLTGSFFSGKTDLEKLVQVIAKLGNTKVPIDAEKLKKIGNAIKPLAEGIAGFSGLDVNKVLGNNPRGGRNQKNQLERFFHTLSAETLSSVADPATMQRAADGITPLGDALNSFSGLDMDALTGGFAEDNLGKFFEGMGKATSNIKEPKKLVEVAVGVRALGDAMQSFKGIDSDKLDFRRFFFSLERGNAEKMRKNLDILVEATGGTTRARGLVAQSQQNEMNVSGGRVEITNNYYTDNSIKSASKTTLIAGQDNPRQVGG